MNQSELLSSAYFSSIEFTTHNIHERTSSTWTRKEGVDFVERRSSFFLKNSTWVWFVGVSIEEAIERSSRSSWEAESPHPLPDLWPWLLHSTTLLLLCYFSFLVVHKKIQALSCTISKDYGVWWQATLAGWMLLWLLGDKSLLGSTATHSSSDPSIVFAHFLVSTCNVFAVITILPCREFWKI